MPSVFYSLFGDRFSVVYSGKVSVEVNALVNLISPPGFDGFNRVVESLDGALAAQDPDEVSRF